jgi:choline monooxygenase
MSMTTTEELVSHVESGSTLPASWYVDEDIFRLEQERIFERSWQCVGLADDLATSGDFITGKVGRVPVVVVRDKAGSLNGFVNVCRHRASIIVQGRGNRSTLQCPYHAWTYGLEGDLLSAPRSGAEAAFDASRFCLEKVAVEVFGPFVFVNGDVSSPSLASQLGDITTRMRADGLFFEGLVHTEHSVSEVAANWKVLVENFNECYHCPVAHPSFSRLVEVDPDRYRLEEAAFTSRAVTPLREHRNGSKVQYPYDVTGENTCGQYVTFWPAFTLSQSPGPRRAVGFYFEPLAPDRTRVVSETFVDPATPPEQIEILGAFSTEVAKEDQRLVEGVQQGLASKRIPHGTLLASERLVRHFDRLVVQAMDPGTWPRWRES